MFCLLGLLFAFMPVHQARAASCAATLSFASTGDSQSQDFQSCNTFIQPGSGSGWTDTSNARWAGMQNSLNQSVRGIFNCGIGVSNGSGGCSGVSPISIVTSNATYSVTGNSANSTLIFTLVSRNTNAAFTDALTYYTYVGAAVASPSDSVTNTPYTFTLNVAAAGSTLAFTPASGTLPDAETGSSYSQSFSVTGGTAPYSWSAAGLPAGLTVNASGALTGTPISPGSYSFSVTVTDALSASVTQNYTLQINQPVPVANTVNATIATGSTSNVVPVSISSGVATSLSIASLPSHGSASVSGLTLLYTPQSGYIGTDTFTYTASNASGTSSPATVNILVSAASLTISPTSGTTLSTATQGEVWSTTVALSGGQRPYRYAATGLPQGLTINSATGVISGTPTTAADLVTFVVRATDANGDDLQSLYHLKIAGQGPKVINHTVMLYAGQNAYVDLTEGASGGPFTAAELLSTPTSAQGEARLSSENGRYRLWFRAASAFSGMVSLQYRLSNSAGTSDPATVTFQVSARPDPSKDAEVLGLLNAQAQAAERFANNQIANFNERLEQLHSRGDQKPQAMNFHIGMPNSAPAPGSRNPDGSLRRQDTDPKKPQSDQGLHSADRDMTSNSDEAMENEDLAFWSGGSIDFGSSDRGAIKLSHTLVGVSTGFDYRIIPDLSLGFGIGYGRDESDIGTNGTESRANAVSAAFYGSFHPGPAYLDMLIGYSYLDFESRRYVTPTGGWADGSRNGQQLFGSLTAGYEFRAVSWVIAPYGRLQFSSTRLQGFEERGADSFNLAFDNQRLDTVAPVAGVRGQYDIPVSWGIVTLRSRVEYSHNETSTSRARLGYADTKDYAYTATVMGLSENALSASAGVDFTLLQGLTMGLGYQGMLATSDGARGNGLIYRINAKF